MREIKYTVSLDGVSPSNVQFGGMQGEHNATRLNVTIDTELFAKLEGAAYRFEAEDGAGCRQTIAMGEIESENVVCSVPQSVTCNGGNVTIRLIFSKVAETEIEYILYSFPIRLRFDLTSNGEFTESKDASDISAAVALAKGYTEKAEQAANMAENAAKTAVNARNGIEQEIAESLTNAKESGEFDGKDGANGKDGVGITSANINAEGQLVLSFSDGKTINLDKVVGMNGTDGIGISSSVINADGELVITYTNGQTANLGVVIGAKGDKGDKGEDGADYILTDDDKNEIATKANAVSYSVTQNLTDEQKQTARENINAVSQAELADGLNEKVDASLVVSNIISDDGWFLSDNIPNGDAVAAFVREHGVAASEVQSLSKPQKARARRNIDVDGGKWELLYTIEGDGETKTWEYTQFADGSPLKLTAVSAVVIQDVAEAENSYGHLYAYCDEKSTHFPAAIYSYFTKNTAPTTPGTQRAYGVVEQYKGQYRAYSVGMAKKGNEIMRYTPYMQAKHTTADYPYIDRIKVQKQTGVFSAGNKIEVYGVRCYDEI